MGASATEVLKGQELSVMGYGLPNVIWRKGQNTTAGGGRTVPPPYAVKG